MGNNIKSNELRLGNYFLHDGNIVQFDEDIMHDVKYGGLEGDEPIPLTEERLLKFGFEKIGTEWILNPSFEIQILVFNHDKYNGVMFYTRTIHTDYSPIYCTNYIKDVHQLQNLYFALTNEELTMK